MNKKTYSKVIKVCIGSACHLKGSYEVIRGIQKYLEEHEITNIELKSSFCLGQCSKAVSVEIDESYIVSMSPRTVNEMMTIILKR